MSEVQTLAEGRFLKLVSKGGWEYATRTNATGVVAIIAITESDELVLVEQHRPPLDAMTIELPAGLVGDEPGSRDEQAEVAAQRELLEETGFESVSVQILATLASSAGLTDETVTFCRAYNITKVAQGGGVGNENITTHLVPKHQLLAWINEKLNHGYQVDAKVLTGMAFIQEEP